MKNSCLYQTKIMHSRLMPKPHQFAYDFFSFYLDLDEIPEVCKAVPWISHNRFNVYSFFDRDHMDKTAGNLKEKVFEYLKTHDIDLNGGRVMLLTYLRVVGYVFNPVSFYFCFDKNDCPICVIPEIGNTFLEIKLFFISKQELNGDAFKSRQQKYYYISPFTKLDDELAFNLTVPGETCRMAIDTLSKGKKVIVTSISGKRTDLSMGNLLKLTLKFPLMTLKVIFLIHWHAMILYFMKIPFEEKTDNLHLQKELSHAFHKSR